MAKRDQPASRLNAEKTPKPRSRGRPFQPGNRGGPGRPKRSVEEAYLDIGTEAVPPEKVRDILAKLADKAGKGDVRAAQVVIKFLYGDDAVLTRKLMAQLAEEIETVRRGELANGSQPAAGRGAEANGALQSAAGPAPGGPEPDFPTGGDDPGCLADGPAARPLFPAVDAV
jgi:hypothetical protein